MNPDPDRGRGGNSWFLQITRDSIAFGMSGYCDFCGATISGQTSKCSGCSALIRPFFGMLDGQLPTDEGRARMNSALAPHRELSREQRIAGLVETMSSSTNLPGPFKTRPGPAPIWSVESCEMWADLLRSMNAQGKPYSCLMPLPGESFLMIEEDGTQTIDGVELPRRLPLHDIAVWLSNPTRRATVSEWDSFLTALSCVTRELSPMEEEQWGPWMGREGWAGFDSPNLLMSHPMRGCSTHPYFEWTGRQCDESPDGVTSIGFIARENRNVMREIGGLPSEAWLEVMEDDERIGELFNSMVAPRLVVVDYKLHLLVLRDGRPHSIPITIDPKVWRVLVSWALEPPGSPGAEMLSYVFWCWNGVNEDWWPSARQLLSTKMLRSAIESFGEDSSLEPVRYTKNSSGIPIRGRSGLGYLVIPSWSGDKFVVEVVPNWEALGAARAHGIQICIDLNGPNEVPSGDIAASYLLHLRDDQGSRKIIHTIGAILHAVESTPQSKDDESVFEWWERVSENFAEIGEGELEEWYDEDLEEEEEVSEEIIEDEPDPFDFELPPPGDMLELREVLERLRRDVQQLQEESD